MWASITTQKNGMVVALLDPEAARTTFACVMFAARIHEEIAPLARIVEQQFGNRFRPGVNGRGELCQ